VQPDAVEPPTSLPPQLDPAWLNDRSEYQRNFVHGLRHPSGLRIQYRVERTPANAEPPPPEPDPLFGHRVCGEWVADSDHMGFPGIAHGGLLVAIVDDVIGRCAALRHRWVVTGRLQTRFRMAAPVGVPLRIEGWLTHWRRRAVAGVGRVLLPDGRVVIEGEGTYLPIPAELEEQMVASWPGFAQYLHVDEPAS
jgi:acyl-coenzyme A thioesterase PaaI-like protein